MAAWRATFCDILQLCPGGGNIDTYNLTYDADDRLTVFSSSADGTAIYSYDANGQLVMTTGSAANPAGEDYDYDPEGNRIVDDDVTGNDSDIGPDNRLLQAGDVSYTYDGNGNRLTSLNITTRNYSVKGGSGGMGAYDYRNRLTSITTTGPTPTDGSTQSQDTAIYTYDVENRRIGREVIDQADDSAPTLEEAYGYDQGQLSLVIDATAAGGNSSGPSEPVTFALAERIMQTPGEADHPLADINVKTGAVTWLLGDEQGSIRDSVTNGSNYHVDFDSYGNVIGTNQPARFGYTGHEQDAESGLVYMNARYYDPSTGTFISEDPTGFGSGDTNLYRYTGNSPTNRTDPTGESWLSSFLDNVLGIDANKTFGISNKTFLGDLLQGQIGFQRSAVDGFGDLTKGNWSALDMDGFNSGYDVSGMDQIVRNTPFHTVGVDFGVIGGSVGYDPGTGLRTLSFNFFGAYLQQSENGHGGLETYLGGHAGIGVGPFELGVTGGGSVDHWEQGFGSATLGLRGSIASLNAGVSSDAEGQLSESAGFNVSPGYGGASVSGGYGIEVGPDGRVTSGFNFNAGYGWNLSNPDAEYEADRNAWSVTSNEGGAPPAAPDTSGPVTDWGGNPIMLASADPAAGIAAAAADANEHDDSDQDWDPNTTDPDDGSSGDPSDTFENGDWPTPATPTSTPAGQNFSFSSNYTSSGSPNSSSYAQGFSFNLPPLSSYPNTVSNAPELSDSAITSYDDSLPQLNTDAQNRALMQTGVDPIELADQQYNLENPNAGIAPPSQNPNDLAVAQYYLKQAVAAQQQQAFIQALSPGTYVQALFPKTYDVLSPVMTAANIAGQGILLTSGGGEAVGGVELGMAGLESAAGYGAEAFSFGDTVAANTLSFEPGAVQGLMQPFESSPVMVGSTDAFSLGIDRGTAGISVNSSGIPSPMSEVTRTIPSSLIADARAQYNLVSGRAMFLDQFATTPEAQAYFTDEELSMMQDNQMPDGWVVHHMQPLFRGGDNSYDNLIVVPQQWHTDNFFDLHYYPQGQNPFGRN